MHTLIKLKFGTIKELIKVNLSATFGGNLMNIHGVIIDYLRTIRSRPFVTPTG